MTTSRSGTTTHSDVFHIPRAPAGDERLPRYCTVVALKRLRISVKALNLLNLFEPLDAIVPRMNAGRLSRRDALAILGAGGLVSAVGRPEPAQTTTSPLEAALARNDEAVRALLERQVSDPASPWRGGVPDQYGLHPAGSASGVAETLTASFVHPESRYRDDRALVERIRLAVGFLERSQSPQGNIDLLSRITPASDALRLASLPRSPCLER